MLAGLFGTLYAGLGAVRALRIAHAAAWGLRPVRGAKPLHGSLWLLAIVSAILLVTALIGWVRHVTFVGGPADDPRA